MGNRTVPAWKQGVVDHLRYLLALERVQSNKVKELNLPTCEAKPAWGEDKITVCIVYYIHNIYRYIYICISSIQMKDGPHSKGHQITALILQKEGSHPTCLA